MMVIYGGKDFTPGEGCSAISVEYIAFVWPSPQNRAPSFPRTDTSKSIDLGFKQLQNTIINDSAKSTIW